MAAHLRRWVLGEEPARPSRRRAVLPREGDTNPPLASSTYVFSQDVPDAAAVKSLGVQCQLAVHEDQGVFVWQRQVS